MSDLKLFRIAEGSAQEITGGSVALEVALQRLIEANMKTLFGVRFVATEYSTGAKHKGRIDSLGLGETGSPVIFEYKRAVYESVINQGALLPGLAGASRWKTLTARSPAGVSTTERRTSSRGDR